MDDYEDAAHLVYGARRYPGGACKLLDPVVFARAREMLLAGMTASKAATSSGYSHLTSFSEAWLRITGLRPSAWQKARNVKMQYVQRTRGVQDKRATWSAADLRPPKRRRKKKKKRRPRGPKVDFI